MIIIIAKYIFKKSKYITRNIQRKKKKKEEREATSCSVRWNWYFSQTTHKF